LLYRSPYARAARKRQEECRQQGTVLDEEDAASLAPEGGPLVPGWLAAAERLQNILQGVSIVGHSRGAKRVVGRDWVEEQLSVDGAPCPLRFRQLEGFFSQPNASVTQQMLAWTMAVARSETAAVGEVGPAREDDLLELYCGNGNFTIALAHVFRQVLATELVKALVAAAHVNAEQNGISNISFARVSSEELAEALQEARCFQRLQHLDLKSYKLNTVLVDPPRAGLGPDVIHFVAGFQRIIYISCNPETLCKDLQALLSTHELRRCAAFDQFPYTEHLEAGVLLVRRASRTVLSNHLLCEPSKTTVKLWHILISGMSLFAFWAITSRRFRSQRQILNIL